MKRLAIAWLWLLTGGVGVGMAAPPVSFPVGERLHYRIFWGPLIIGQATLEVRAIEAVDGHDCYHLVAAARTTGLGRLFFKLDSRTESWLDVDELCSRRFSQKRQEGNHRKQTITTFDYQNGQVVTRNLLNGREQRAPLDQPVQDIISSLYYVRTQPLALDRATLFTVNASDQNWLVTVRPDKRQRFEFHPVGEIEALRVEPQPTLQFVSRHNGRLWFWISDDQRKLPLQVSSTMSIGTAQLMLHRVENGSAVQMTRAVPAVVAAR